MERLECEIEMEKERWRWRRVSGGIRMGDRVNGKIRMGDGVSGEIRMGGRWVDYKRRKKWAWEEKFFGEKILDVWEGFGRLKKNLRERKYQKERENFEDDGSLKLEGYHHQFLHRLT